MKSIPVVSGKPPAAALLAAALALFASGPAHAQPDLISKAVSEGAVRVIVGLETGFRPEGTLTRAYEIQAQREKIASAQERILNRLASFYVGAAKRFRYVPYLALEVDAAGLRDLMSDREVISIEEDVLRRPTLSGSTPAVGAAAAWAEGFSGLGRTVAVLDTGVDKNHSFLAGKVLSEACYSSNTSFSTSLCPGGVSSTTASGSGLPCELSIPGCDHGTHVAGIAAGRGSSFSGVARDASLLSVQVFSRFDDPYVCGSSFPCIASFTSDQIRGLERIYELRGTYEIAAVNMSLGGGRYTTSAACDADNASVKAAIDNLRSAGIATVVAAGNDGFPDALSAPACISTAVSVASTTKTDAVSSFSNLAPFLSFFAPGQSILSSVPGGDFASLSGTSMAAPHVAGAWAILKESSPASTVDEVLAALRDSGVPISVTRSGVTTTKPRIQIDAALDAMSSALMEVDSPLEGDHVSVPFPVEGWAIDRSSPSGTGVDAVHVWAFPDGGGNPTFLGAATLGIDRPDVVAIHGSRFALSGFELSVGTHLAPGGYTLQVSARSTSTGTFNNNRSVRVTVEPPPSDPVSSIGKPLPGAEVTVPFRVAGWVIDRSAESGAGVDAVHVWAFPAGGGDAIFLGAAEMGIPRPGVAAAFGTQFEPSGFRLDVTQPLAVGVTTIRVYARSTVTGTFSHSTAVEVMVAGSATVPIMTVGNPDENALVTVPFTVQGWAVDLGAPDGVGVDAVHVYAFPDAGGNPVFLGVATLGIYRAGVASLYGDQFAPSGYRLVVEIPLAPGGYTIYVFARSTVTRTFNNQRRVAVAVGSS